MSRSKALFAGLLAGLIAGIAMTVVMLVLACFGVATPLAIIGDRLSVFIKPGPFLSIMGRVGGYNHLKQLGVGSTMVGQLIVSALGGAVFGLLMRSNPQRRVTKCEGGIVRPITPDGLFYCVTKNVVRPRVNVDLWHLELNGLVQNSVTYRFQDLKGFNLVEQETTLMCISNGLDAGLMSNAVWKGIALRDLLDPAGPLADAQRVRLCGVDNYTDTIPIEKALDPTTLLAWAMNGVDLPHRHGYPLRAIVPGYFGEKHVKWLTRIELTGADAKGFYETQGWGPDFITPTRSRIDVPDHDSRFTIHDSPIEMKGIAFGGDRGISRVEISDNDGETWADAKIDYPGTKLTWALWSYDWRPDDADDYTLIVRATDGEGAVQEWEEGRSPFSGVTGFHKIVVHVTV